MGIVMEKGTYEFRTNELVNHLYYVGDSRHGFVFEDIKTGNLIVLKDVSRLQYLTLKTCEVCQHGRVEYSQIEDSYAYYCINGERVALDPHKPDNRRYWPWTNTDNRNWCEKWEAGDLSLKYIDGYK